MQALKCYELTLMFLVHNAEVRYTFLSNKKLFETFLTLHLKKIKVMLECEYFVETLSYRVRMSNV